MKKLIIPSIIVGCLVVAFFLTREVDANPSQLLEDKSASATTTLSYLTAGTATTTDVFDTQADGGFITDSATLLMWIGASSTASILDIYPQYSNGAVGVDCAVTPLKCDWYFASNPENYATTTMISDISFLSKYRLTFTSSSTPTGLEGGNYSSTTRAISIKTPVRYARVIFAVPVGSQSIGVWSDWVGKKQK